MQIIQIAVIGIIATIFAVLVKKNTPDFAIIISLIASVVLFLYFIPYIGEISITLRALSGLVKTKTEYISIVLKIVGIAYIAEFASQLCIDAGEASIGHKIELAGKVIIMVVSGPIILDLVNLVVFILP